MYVPENLDQFYWKGKNIIIRTERESDAKAKWEEYFDTEARRLLEDQTELPISYEAYAKMFTNCESIDYHSERISLYIDNLEGDFIGWININDLDMRHGTFSLGGSIFRQYQRRGYGTEAAAMVLDYCFNELRLHKCNNACLAMNEAAIKVHQCLGFREEGRMRETVYFDGKYHDIVRAELLQRQREGNGDLHDMTSSLNNAVADLQQTGQMDCLPFGYLARAAFYRIVGEFANAWDDLEEMREVADRGEMRLYLADYHLEASRLCVAEKKFEGAQQYLSTAKTMIDDMGYHRRDKEVEELTAILKSE